MSEAPPAVVRRICGYVGLYVWWRERESEREGEGRGRRGGGGEKSQWPIEDFVVYMGRGKKRTRQKEEKTEKK